MHGTRLSKDRRPFFSCLRPSITPSSPRIAIIATFLSYLFVCLLSVQRSRRKGVISTTANSVVFSTYSCYIFLRKDFLFIKYKNMIWYYIVNVVHRFRPLCKVCNLLLCLLVNYANFYRVWWRNLTIISAVNIWCEIS